MKLSAISLRSRAPRSPQRVSLGLNAGEDELVGVGQGVFDLERHFRRNACACGHSRRAEQNVCLGIRTYQYGGQKADV